MERVKMNVTRLDAAKRQLATAIRLYFEDCDPVSVHTLVMAANEIIERLCERNGTPAMRSDFLAMIIPGRRKEFGTRFNKARNFFKHGFPNEVLEDFSDEQNLVGIVMAVHGLRLLRVELPEARAFMAWLSIAEPGLMMVSLPTELLSAFDLDDIQNQPRAVQKETGRHLLRHLVRMGFFRNASSPAAAGNPLRSSE